MEIVDAQIHLWTATTAPPHHRQTPFVIAQALREMDAAGVAKAVNCPALWDPDANAYAIEAATHSAQCFVDGRSIPSAQLRVDAKLGLDISATERLKTATA